MFRFAHPQYLYLLAIIPVLTGVFIYYLYSRRKKLEKLGKPATILSLMPASSVRRSVYKFICLLAAFTFFIIALARPQSGAKLREIRREGIEIMFIVDISNSMLAQDLEPSRLELTKHSINRLLEGISEDKVGLIVFAGDAYVQLPITSDYISARSFISRISTNTVSKQGTAIGTAINLASNSFSSQSEGSRVAILITDGENHEDDALQAAIDAAAKGIAIYVIGIGTPEGAPVRIDGNFITDQSGNMVVTKLDESLLQEIALATGGSYIRATKQNFGLTEIIQKINETQKAELVATVFDDYYEHYQSFMAVGMTFLLLSFIILPRKNRLMARFNVFK